jgi:dihydropteroate synthase
MLTLEGLAGLLEQHGEAAQAQVRNFSIGNRSFDFNACPAIMGVVNLSPDSWYRESVCLSVESAVQRTKVLQAQGADLIDIGTESTLAHAARVDDQLQQSKLLPVLREVRSTDIPISIETYEPSVAQAVLEAGAAVINFTGQETAEPIYRLVAEHQATVIICHVQGPNVREVGDLRLGHDPIPDFQNYFQRQIELAERCGVTKILLDPGLGFYYRNLQDSSARIRYQMATFLNSFRLRTLGWPVCHALPHAFEYFQEAVRCAEPFFAVLAALGKTDLFRTHEVPRTKAVLDTLQVYSASVLK